MTEQATDSQPPGRRRVPPAWLVLLAGLGFFAAAAIRYYGDSARSWEIQAVAGALFVVGGFVLAAVKRSFR